ncbi:acyltransferase [Roseomonas hellenica]|uniref:Acyltransferase n=1 Tax=Plastoroseomonas hellenica TaxID=2687306 RepID=A0ABS5ETZ0_9PROT|nr:acyltransferase [Plastoroseomonas hellenica]MBR0663757.1 acyltransferase [Plastoroseomonas hellenica]
MTTPPSRLIELDSLRGVAAFIVVLHHAFIALPQVPGWVSWMLFSTPLRPIGIGRPAVIFFFVLSGYVLTRALRAQEASRPGSVLSAPGWLGYAGQRAVRLGLPVLASLLLSALLQGLVWRGPMPEETPHLTGEAGWYEMWTWPALLLQALLMRHGDGFQLNPVLWTLVHEWRINLLLPIALLFINRWALLVAVALLGAGIAQLAGMPEGGVSLGDSLPQTFIASAGFLPAFAAGAALALGRPPRLDGPQAMAAGIAILVMAASAHDYGVIAGSVLLILLAQREGRFAEGLRHPALVWLGRISFSLYLVHMPLLLMTTHLLRDGGSPLLAAAIAIALAFPAAALMHRFVEQPAHRLARRIRPPSTRLSPAAIPYQAR